MKKKIDNRVVLVYNQISDLVCYELRGYVYQKVWFQTRDMVRGANQAWCQVDFEIENEK